MGVTRSDKHELDIQVGPVKIQAKNMSNKVLLLIAGTIFILGIGIAYSFIKGWSTLTIAAERAEKAEAMVKDMEDEMIIRSALDAERYQPKAAAPEDNND